MKKSQNISKLFLTLSLMLCCRTTLADTLKIEDLQCLARPAKEAFAICIEQNKECHKSLHDAEASSANDLEYFIGTFLLGAAAGIILTNGIHH